MTLIATYICAKHMDATFIETSGQCVKCLEDEIHRLKAIGTIGMEELLRRLSEKSEEIERLRAALRKYANSDLWEFAKVYATGLGGYAWEGEYAGMPWTIAEEALK